MNICRLLILAIVLGCAAPGLAEQRRLTPGPVLDTRGTLRSHGWSPTEVLSFDAAAVTAPPSRLRRWDFFTVANPRFAVNFTLADVGFARFCSVDVIDFRDGRTFTNFALPLVSTRDVLKLSATSRGSTICKMGRDEIRFETYADRRVLTVDMPGGLFTDGIRGALTLQQPRTHQFLSLAMPFTEAAGTFFYENKIPALPAAGTLEVAGERLVFDAADSFGIMDWGRGVWPAEVTWHWGGAAGRVDGEVVGFNLGYGFGDTSAATENVIVVGGVAHKLGVVDWHFDRSDWMKPWKLTSPDGRVALDFTPVYPQVIDVDVGFKAAVLHKVYGTYRGTLVLDDGRALQVELFGFAEEMGLRW